MAFLVVGGVTVHVATSGATKKAIERIGSSTRAFAGNLRTTVRAEKRAWQFTTHWLTNTDAAALETAVALGAHVVCSGDALGGSITCEGTLGDGPYLPKAGATFRRQVVLTLREV